MIDANHINLHPYACGAKDGKGVGDQYEITLGVVDASGMSLRVFITAGTTADCTQAIRLIKGLDAENLLADRGHDSDEIINQARSQKMAAVIPPRSNRKEQRFYDKDLYKFRRLVENAFLHLKRWRGIATRYALKTLLHFMLLFVLGALPFGLIPHDDSI